MKQRICHLIGKTTIVTNVLTHPLVILESNPVETSPVKSTQMDRIETVLVDVPNFP